MAEKTTVKPGFKTSEFWLTLVAMLVGLFVASGVLPESHIVMKIAGFALTALAQLGYSITRAGVKKAANGKSSEPEVDANGDS